MKNGFDRGVLTTAVTFLVVLGFASLSPATDLGGERGDGVWADPFAPTVYHDESAAPSEDGSVNDGGTFAGPPLALEEGGDPSGQPPRPIWQRLADLTETERASSTIELEPAGDIDPALAGQAAEVVALWNAGRSDEALAQLQALDAAGAPYAVGVSWVNGRPQEMSSVRVGTHTGFSDDQHLVAHGGTGNLFAIVDDDDDEWIAYFSNDGGATWTETYHWYSITSVVHVDAVAAGPYLYVAYVEGDVPEEARLRRLHAATGAVDTVYYYQVVYTDIFATDEVALASDSDYSNLRLYYFGVQSDGLMMYYWTDEDGGTGTLGWTSTSTGVGDANGGMDAVYNAPGSYFLFVSYVGMDGNLYAWRRASVAGNDVHSFGVPAFMDDQTSVSAFNNQVMIAYKNSSDSDIEYRVTYDGGGGWSWGTVSTDPGWEPRVTLRHGAGAAFMWQSDDAGADDWLRLRWRSYPCCNWRGDMRVNDFDTSYGAPVGMARLPDGGYGALTVYYYGSGWYTRYDEAPLLFIGDFEFGAFDGWASVNH